MNEKITRILCRKKGVDFLFFIDEKECSIDEVCDIVGNNPAYLIEFETVENDRVLLSGYLTYQNKKSFIRRLSNLARAKVNHATTEVVGLKGFY